MALIVKVAPDDSHQPVSELLREDQHTMSDTMFEIRKERIQKGLSDPHTTGVTMVQDIWHARERVARALNRGHADYYPALAELKIIFARYALIHLDESMHP